MKHIRKRRICRIEDLVAAAYEAAWQVTRSPLPAAILVGKVLEDWLARCDRLDLLKRLHATSFQICPALGHASAR
jgi:hypothetical protein